MDDAESGCRGAVFRPAAMAPQRGASLVKGGRRLSGQMCWNGDACKFKDDCKYVHVAAAAADGMGMGRVSYDIPGPRPGWT